MENPQPILYVEDCDLTVELLKRSFDRHCPEANIALDVAETVSHAVELFSTEKHVAALIDWNLPDGDGTEVAQHIRKHDKTVPIIFLSAAFADEHFVVAKKYRPGGLVKDHSKKYVESIIQYIPHID